MSDVIAGLAGRRVLVVGDLMLDEYIVGDATRISAEAPVPVVRFGSERAVLGGAANTAANVASLGGRATLVGLLGDDAAGTALKKMCAGAGIEVRAVADGRATTRKVRVMSQNQQLLRIDYEETAPPSPAHQEALLGAFAAAVQACDIVVVSDYAKGVITPTVAAGLLSGAHAAGKEVVVDPRPQHALCYVGCDYLTPNWKESLGLLGEPEHPATDLEIVRVGTALGSRFRSNVLLTLGSRGMAYFAREGSTPVHVEAAAREVFDVSGAGDTVVAAFALARAAGIDARRAVDLANRAAGVVVGKRGTATVVPTELGRDSA